MKLGLPGNKQAYAGVSECWSSVTERNVKVRGKIQVIAPGALGEADKELDPIVYRMARLTAKTPFGQMLAPQYQSKWRRC
jgi:hypothetical protein